MKTSHLPNFSKTVAAGIMLLFGAVACGRCPDSSSAGEHLSPVITIGLSVNAKLNHSNTATATGKDLEATLPNIPDQAAHITH